MPFKQLGGLEPVDSHIIDMIREIASPNHDEIRAFTRTDFHSERWSQRLKWCLFQQQAGKRSYLQSISLISSLAPK